MEKLKRRELYEFDIQKDYLFRNLITDELVLGKLIDIQFNDDITDPIHYVITNLETNQKNLLNSSKYSRTQYDLNEKYFLRNKLPLTLTNITLAKNKKKGTYIFVDNDKNEIQKPISKKKLPNSFAQIINLKNNDIFLKKKGTLRIFKCINIIPANNLEDFQIELSDIMNSDKKSIIFSFSDLIIRPRKIYLSISRSNRFREFEVNIIEWLYRKQLQSYIYLKKPVNNLEIGYIQKINVDFLNNKKKITIDNKIEDDNILIKNIFDKQKKIPFKKLEVIYFEYKSAVIQLKSSTSLTSRLGYRILKKFKPERIIMT